MINKDYTKLYFELKTDIIDFLNGILKKEELADSADIVQCDNCKQWVEKSDLSNADSLQNDGKICIQCIYNDYGK